MNVKIGQEVTIYQGSSMVFRRVEKVTPSGQFVVSGGMRFTKHGLQIGGLAWVRADVDQVRKNLARQELDREYCVKWRNIVEIAEAWRSDNPHITLKRLAAAIADLKAHIAKQEASR